MSRIRSAHGFMLLELLVVIVIIGLLSAFVAPKYFGQIGRSRTQIAMAQVESFEKALDQYRINVGHYPATDAGLIVLFSPLANESNWRGPYLKKGVPQDPWGHAYLYRSPGSEGREYEIVSFGSDGAQGGGGEDADIESWK
ncbi:type II secretion system major pseudopilin GspG [Janthinobacterium sp. SUN100]|uniref:type II secretion system major pseudopilin GspG n=1 Tax=Janthinobacterium sp. SUN100 TaxID=3004101 RepID=UPI0025B04FA0|nr:type II secretion system major pseudopilin GspG [Janthinobacterium sp. SUN100]MDN2700404.1 type II secretion system major pseudopilin GspG [Janthinobacterium sp. SUN100]